MSKSLSQIIRERSNDYSALEEAYRTATGGELVYEPFTSPQHSHGEITLSASVIIPAWNAQHTIAQCLIAIEQSSFNRRYPHLLEVIVVDDGSTDGTWELLTHLQLDLNLKVVGQLHYSRAHAMNTGISIANGDILISCDADIILCPFSIEELVKRHQVLEKVLLIGFRFDVGVNDLRLHSSALREKIASSLPKFYGDNRVVFHWPGWPENMCVESNHLKQLGHGKQFWVTDGRIPDGDSWDLPRMVYGALFSLSCDDLKQMGGYDERFYGWGWEDTLVGARAVALENFVIPVYSAVGMHVAHPDRSPNKWQEAAANYQLLQSALRSPFISSEEVFTRARKRILRKMEHFSSGTCSDIPSSWFDVFETVLNDRGHLGKYLYHLGCYDEAAKIFAGGGDGLDEPSMILWQGKALRAAGHYAEAIRILTESVKCMPDTATPLIELGLALAASGRFEDAHASLEQAWRRDPQHGLLAYILNCPWQMHFRRGRKYMSQGFYSLAKRDFEAVLIREPFNVVARQEWEKILMYTS